MIRTVQIRASLQDPGSFPYPAHHAPGTGRRADCRRNAKKLNCAMELFCNMWIIASLARAGAWAPDREKHAPPADSAAGRI